jgi:ubiquinone biosynthesis protein UbiJ
VQELEEFTGAVEDVRDSVERLAARIREMEESRE